MRIRDVCVAIVLTMAGLLASACAGSPWWSETLDSWVGASQQEVLAAWGPPAFETAGPDGTLLMVYEHVAEVDQRAIESWELSRGVDPAQREPDPPLPEFVCNTTFELKDGVVTRVEARGSGCDPRPRPGGAS